MTLFVVNDQKEEEEDFLEFHKTCVRLVGEVSGDKPYIIFNESDELIVAILN